MKKLILLSVLSAVTLFTNAQTKRYVIEGGSGQYNGSSWSNASPNLQEMINLSSAGDSVFVAAGEYKPVSTANGYNAATGTYPSTPGNHCDRAFVLKPDVKIFGGFPNTGNPSFSQRDWKVNQTVLEGNHASNLDCHHVVVSSGPVGSACLDGFVIRKSGSLGTPGVDYPYNPNYTSTPMTVNGNTISVSWTGGITIYNSSPLLQNLVVKENIGGGIYMNNSSAIIINTLIHGNKSYTSGGGIKSVESSPLIINSTITKNIANDTAVGMYNVYSTPIICNSIISGNSSSGADVINISSYPTYYHSLVRGETVRDDFGRQFPHSRFNSRYRRL